jgi:hypothetical protein
MSKLTVSSLLFAGLIAAGFSSPARANVVYTLTFDKNSTVVGTGSLTLDFTALSQADNLSESLASILVGVSTSNLDGNGTFSITSSNLASGSFIDTGNVGQIYSLTAEEAGTGSNSVLFLDLFTNSWQLHNGNDNGATDDQGSFTIAGPTLSATPLPATLPLFAGGLGLIGYLVRRKKGGTSLRALAAA